MVWSYISSYIFCCLFLEVKLIFEAAGGCWLFVEYLDHAHKNNRKTSQWMNKFIPNWPHLRQFTDLDMRYDCIQVGFLVTFIAAYFIMLFPTFFPQRWIQLRTFASSHQNSGIQGATGSSTRLTGAFGMSATTTQKPAKKATLTALSRMCSKSHPESPKTLAARAARAVIAAATARVRWPCPMGMKTSTANSCSPCTTSSHNCFEPCQVM